MFGSVFVSDRCFRFGRRCSAVVLAACLALPGCTSLDTGSDELTDGQISDLLGPVRPLESDLEFFGVSNKAREIEKNCMR